MVQEGSLCVRVVKLVPRKRSSLLSSLTGWYQTAVNVQCQLGELNEAKNIQLCKPRAGLLHSSSLPPPHPAAPRARLSSLAACRCGGGGSSSNCGSVAAALLCGQRGTFTRFWGCHVMPTRKPSSQLIVSSPASSIRCAACFFLNSV